MEKNDKIINLIFVNNFYKKSVFIEKNLQQR